MDSVGTNRSRHPGPSRNSLVTEDVPDRSGMEGTERELVELLLTRGSYPADDGLAQRSEAGLEEPEDEFEPALGFALGLALDLS